MMTIARVSGVIWSAMWTMSGAQPCDSSQR
jgi:hypothetical protein